MTMMYDRIADLLVEHFEVDRSELSPDVTFDDLGVDSLFMVEMLLILQTELGVQISEDVAAPEDTIGQAAESIDKQVAAAATPS